MVLRGNVRELEIDMRRVVALAESGELIAVRHLPPEITKQNGDATTFQRARWRGLPINQPRCAPDEHSPDSASLRSAMLAHDHDPGEVDEPQGCERAASSAPPVSRANRSPVR
jgi:transcriptional regulator with PAS, ATPase and Fis domain